MKKLVIRYNSELTIELIRNLISSALDEHMVPSRALVTLREEDAYSAIEFMWDE